MSKMAELEYEKRIGADQPPTERMAFNDWWNAPITTHSTEDNPYRLRSPAYWAWEGWQAGTKAEREACAAICERHATAFLDGEELSDWKSGYGDGAGACFNVIRARGQE